MKLESIKQKINSLLDDTQDSDPEAVLAKYQGIIDQLSTRKAALKTRMLEVSESDQTSEAYRELEYEFRVVSRLLKKAHQQFNAKVSENG